jgi:hypothetical protein
LHFEVSGMNGTICHSAERRSPSVPARIRAVLSLLRKPALPQVVAGAGDERAPHLARPEP